MKYNGPVPGYILENDSTIIPYESSPYGLLDFSVQRSWFGKNLTIALGAKNLLGVTDVNTLVQGSAHNDASGQSMIGMGRNYFIRMSCLLNNTRSKKSNEGEAGF